MRLLWPSPQQERWLAALALAAPGHLDAAQLSLSAERSGGWRRVRFFSRCAFFVLALIAAALTVGIFHELHVPGGALLPGLLLIGAGESLIARRRVFAGGTEEALTLSGVLCVTYSVLPTGPYEDFRLLPLAAAAALAVVGIRLLNSLCTTAAFVAASFVSNAVRPLEFAAHSPHATRAAVFCFAVASVALVLGRLRYARPSHDRMLDWLVAVMPLAGFLWCLSAMSQVPAQSVSPEALAYFHVQPVAAALMVAMPLLYASAAFVTGLRRRTHAPLIAGLACMGCVAYALHLYSTMSLQNRLLLGGFTTLLCALALNRALRVPRRGITSRQIGSDHGALEFLQLAGTASLAPQSAAAADPSFKGGGGAFSGGGADGTY